MQALGKGQGRACRQEGISQPRDTGSRYKIMPCMGLMDSSPWSDWGWGGGKKGSAWINRVGRVRNRLCEA